MNTYHLESNVIKIIIFIVLFIAITIAFIYFLMYKLSNSKVAKLEKKHSLNKEYLPLLALGSTQLYKEQHATLNTTLNKDHIVYILNMQYAIYNSNNLFVYIEKQLNDDHQYNLRKALHNDDADLIQVKKAKSYIYSIYNLTFQEVNSLSLIAYSIEHSATALRLAYNADYISEETCIMHMQKLLALAKKHYENEQQYIQGYILGCSVSQKGFEQFEPKILDYITYLLGQLWS